ncbi:hypothetical protein [Ottowia sp.]|jgi:predicted transcriptional regulator|uniref:hypothetical protein n=1 Tax=Ottowia sp. TaxID=1898956 RepID=UPI0025FFE87B|nr:hypothetical protein [Ottowia sp.]MBK6614261.1 hypothetical protein [Ottowia sp.]MBK6745181.1 hypothetical protein [Ottowia sp.]
MPKAIIEIQAQARFFQAARRGAAAMQRRKGDADFYLSYPSARDLYSDLTPARLGLLGLVEQTEAGAWRVPFNGVEIRVAMVHAA